MRRNRRGARTYTDIRGVIGMNIRNEKTSCMANRINQWAALTGITMLMSGVPVSAADNGLFS